MQLLTLSESSSFGQTRISIDEIKQIPCAFFSRENLPGSVEASQLNTVDWTPDFIEFRDESADGYETKVYSISWDKKKSSLELDYLRGEGVYQINGDWCKLASLDNPIITGEYSRYRPDGSLAMHRTIFTESDTVTHREMYYPDKTDEWPPELITRIWVDGEQIFHGDKNLEAHHIYCGENGNAESGYVVDFVYTFPGGLTYQCMEPVSEVQQKRHSPMLELTHGTMNALWCTSYGELFERKEVFCHDVRNVVFEGSLLGLEKQSEWGLFAFENYTATNADQTLSFSLSGPLFLSNCPMKSNSILINLTGNSDITITSVFDDPVFEISVSYSKNGIVRTSSSMKHGENGFQMFSDRNNFNIAIESGEIFIQCNKQPLMTFDSREVFKGSLQFSPTGCTKPYIERISLKQFGLSQASVPSACPSKIREISPSSSIWQLGVAHTQIKSNARISGNVGNDNDVLQVVFTEGTGCSGEESSLFVNELEFLLGKRFKLVERQNSKILKDELKLHLSGLVSQSSTLAAGNWKGASSVVIAELVCGSTKSANIQVVEIESSEVKYHFINSIEREGSVKDLLSRFAE